MNIGTILLLLISTVVSYKAWTAYTSVYKVSIPTNIVFGQQVGRTRSIQSKTSDASMFTEFSRRKAIVHYAASDSTFLPKKAIRETRTSSGSYSGAVESYILSGFYSLVPSAIVTPPVITPEYPTVLDGRFADTTDYEYVVDGGNAYSDYTFIFDGNGI